MTNNGWYAIKANQTKQLNAFMFFYQTQIFLFTINHLFGLS